MSLASLFLARRSLPPQLRSLPAKQTKMLLRGDPLLTAFEVHRVYGGRLCTNDIKEELGIPDWSGGGLAVVGGDWGEWGEDEQVSREPAGPMQAFLCDAAPDDALTITPGGGGGGRLQDLIWQIEREWGIGGLAMCYLEALRGNIGGLLEIAKFQGAEIERTKYEMIGGIVRRKMEPKLPVIEGLERDRERIRDIDSIAEVLQDFIRPMTPSEEEAESYELLTNTVLEVADRESNVDPVNEYIRTMQELESLVPGSRRTRDLPVAGGQVQKSQSLRSAVGSCDSINELLKVTGSETAGLVTSLEFKGFTNRSGPRASPLLTYLLKNGDGMMGGVRERVREYGKRAVIEDVKYVADSHGNPDVFIPRGSMLHEHIPSVDAPVVSTGPKRQLSKPPATPLRLSATAIKSYLSCPRQYDLKYNLMFEAEPTSAMRRGSNIHQSIQNFWDNIIASGAKVTIPVPPELQLQYGPNANIVPRTTETKFEQNFGVNLTMSGVYDLVADVVIDGKVVDSVIYEYKTGKQRPAEVCSGAGQAIIYGVASGAWVGVVNVDTGKSMFMSPKQVQRQKQEAINIIDRVADGIRRGDFFSKKSFLGCKFCNAANVCSRA